MKANETPILSYDNLQAVLWRFESFVRNLRFNSDITVRICHDQRSDIEFKNVSHRAIQEIKKLLFHDKGNFIGYYLEEFEALNDKLKLVIDRLEDKSHANLINIAKIEIDNVFYYLNLYNSRYNEQRNNNETEPIQHPFKDDDTAKLFEYIVENWKYDKDQKWADIWNGINESANYKPPYQNEYQSYIIKRFKYTGRFQYSYWKDKAPSNRNRNNLIDLIKNFSKK